MKAAVVKALGTAPVYADFSDPHDRDGAVVATVEAAALKNLDRVMISGKHYSGAHLPLPMVAGVDGVTLPAGTFRSAGIELVGMGLGSVPADAVTRAAVDHLPRLFEMVASGKLHLQTQRAPLSQVENVWTGQQAPGSRVVLVP